MRDYSLTCSSREFLTTRSSNLFHVFMLNMKDKVVLVTGANRGIGKAFVDAFLAHGASKVYAAVRDIDSIHSTFDASLITSNRVVPIYMDLSRPETIHEAATTTATDVDIVVNNAGIISRRTPLDEDAIEQLQAEMTVNVYGLMHVAQAFAPVLESRPLHQQLDDDGRKGSSTRKKGGGILIQINSVASMRCGLANVATYSASKAAAFSMTQALRQQLAPRNVTVISVHPGPIATDMLADIPELAHVAEPPCNVAEAVIKAIEEADNDQSIPFMIFPDEKARQLGTIFHDYGKRVIEDGNMYG
jgi:NAD(P)-dependent dehydrogenase (short-subunit alcohol dehydrogenase family)